ncbi:MAG: cytochrome c biogenesis protein CcsA, partial [Archaeoglobaceae archaeon]
MISSILFFLSSRKIKLAEVGELFLYASFSSILASVLLLLYYILTDDFSILYVYLNSQREMTIWFKICALWAGKEGSLLLWNFLNLLVASVFVNHGKKDLKKAKIIAHLLALNSSLLILNLFSNPFIELPFKHLNGIGMNPILRSFEMLIHPPIVFTGYALTALVYFSHLFGSPNRDLVRLAWLFLTAGIVLGGVWAYKTLGWGGFWGWDPVENSSLLPWLALTAYFHIKKGREFFAYLAMVFVIFTAFVTRSGILSSVHTFSQDAFGFAFLAILLTLSFPLFKRWKFEDFCFSSLIFSAMILVVLLGIVANFFRNVERSYYLITFTPLFSLAILGILYKFRESNRKLIHLGVILLFIGSNSVWFFEERTSVVLNPSGSAYGVDFEFIDLNSFFDGEKFTTRVKILSSVGTFEPEIHFYDNWGQVKKISIISTPFLDYYLAVNSVSQDLIVIEFYKVPMISFVWIGSALLILAEMIRFR